MNKYRLLKMNSRGGRYYAEGPSGGPEWGARFVITFLFPK